MHATYNSWLVALSIAVAVLVSSVAFRLAARVAESERRARRYWLLGGAVAMGIGIWSMHFIGMLAFSLPIDLRYDVPKTLASLAVAIVSSGLAIEVSSGPRLGGGRLLLGGLVMGCGIAGMHYLGMAAIDIVPGIRYQISLIVASTAVAVVGSCGALWLLFRPFHGRAAVMLGRFGGAALMGLAIGAMHYIGMAASVFGAGSYCRGGISLNSDWLAVTTALVAASVLTLALLTDIYTAEIALRARAHAHSLQEVNAQLHHQSMHDALTGLPNRQLFFERLRSALSDVDGSHFAVMMIDLDRFKLVNDSLGHAAGDKLLREVAHRLTTALRKSDTVARMGGDEFLVLASGVSDAAEVAPVVAKVLEAFNAPLRLGNLEVRAAPSIGISFYPRDGRDANSLVARADEAMYSAKKSGGNTFQCFATEMSTYARERLQLENDLSQALVLRQFELHYQPRVDIVSGRIVSVEALIRWRHPQKGYVPPQTFIPIAEETGLMLPIGEWVLREACRQARLWQQSGLPIRVAVNLSAVQFRHPDLLGVVRAALIAQQLPPRMLELELTESAVMTNAESSVAIFEQLSELGVVVALDDFGTGYSNMSYLLRFPIDRLKIDVSFVRGMTQDQQSLLIVKAIISLAHSLKMKVIAEGVETLAQLEQLSSLGCDQCQGFLFGRPAPALAIESELRARASGNAPERMDPAQTYAKLAHPVWGALLSAKSV
jgi:diguanylate cyclase (GGDEF)-like protein